MLGRTLITAVLRQSASVWRPNAAVMNRPAVPAFSVPRRTWAQVGHIVVTPPRVPVSAAEKVAHMLFMLTIWFTPTFFFLTQVKVWRRLYVET